MKPTTLLIPFLAGAGLATPIAGAQNSDPKLPTEDFNGPNAWKFTLQSWSGDGCPDFQRTNETSAGYMNTRQSNGPMLNTSLSTYWSYVAFPWMQAQLDPNDPSRTARVRCDLTLLYEEVTESGSPVPEDKRTHRLRLHKNGSLIQANYMLDKGVTAEWQVRFSDPETFTVMAQDWGSIDGPLEAGNDEDMALEWLPPLFTLGPFVQRECGRSVFRVRLDLWLAGRTAGAGGTVGSKKVDWNNGKGPLVHGVNLGYSYDWEKC